MSTNKQKKPKKEKIPLSKDRKKELIYIGTIIVLITVIIVMFALKFVNKAAPNNDETTSHDNAYYVAVDPYKIPDRTEEETKNLYENEIIVRDVWYRLNLPFTITTNTITNEFPDKFTNLTGVKDYVGYINSISYAVSLTSGLVEYDDEGNQVFHDVDPVPFVLMIVNCRDEASVADILSELRENFPKDWFGEDFPTDDLIIHSSNGHKITICAMNSKTKQKLGFSAVDVMNNLDYYLLTYDGRYKDQQPPMYSDSIQK